MSNIAVRFKAVQQIDNIRITSDLYNRHFKIPSTISAGGSFDLFRPSFCHFCKSSLSL